MQQKYWTLPMNIECYKWSKLVYENILKIEPTVLKFEFAQCWEWRIQFTNFQIAMKIERLINYYNVLYNFGCIQIKVGLVVLGTWFWLYSFFFFFCFGFECDFGGVVFLFVFHLTIIDSSNWIDFGCDCVQIIVRLSVAVWF